MNVNVEVEVELEVCNVIYLVLRNLEFRYIETREVPTYSLIGEKYSIWQRVGRYIDSRCSASPE
jgi:hypothetical protein